MDKKKEISAVEKERAELAQKIQNWVNENPEERVCVCILSSGGTTTALVVGSHKFAVESTASAIDTEESAVKQIVQESLILSAMSGVFKESFWSHNINLSYLQQL